MGMNLGNALIVKAENRSVSMIGGSPAWHNRKPPSIVLDAGDSMSIIALAFCRSHVQTPGCESKLYLNMTLFPEHLTL